MSQHAPRSPGWPMLFPPAHTNAPAGTSEAAARSMARPAPPQRERVLDLIRRAGPRGVTDAEGERALGMRTASYTARRNELVGRGVVVDSGRRRRTESGRSAAVWVAVKHAPRAGRAEREAGGGG